MDGSHLCTSCEGSLQPEDGHDLCPVCLGPEHLWEALSGNPYMDCSYLPRAVRAARLAELEHPGDEGELPPSDQPPPVHQRHSNRLAAATAVAPPKKKAKSDHSRLSSEVEQLSAELAQMRSMLTDRQPEAP